ncbi:MAG: hypothetical protein Q9171_003487 [Xanthocarpia ochracea]
MSSRHQDWENRARDMGAEHHGTRDPDQYIVDRKLKYPKVGPGFPRPHHLNGYDADQRYTVYKQACNDNYEPRNKYHTTRAQHDRDIEQMKDDKEHDYYKYHTGGVTPLAHAELKPLARKWADAETRHAELREEVYARAPMMYGTREGQDNHLGYIDSRWQGVVRAEDNYDDHAKFEHDPNSTARDCYGRGVPHGALPASTPYLRGPPPPDHYSAELDYPAFAMKPAKQKKHGRKH